MLLVNAILRMLEIVEQGLFNFTKKITMNTDFEWLMAVAMLLVLAGLFYLIFEMLKIKAAVIKTAKQQPDQTPLRLQAYERLTIFTERMNLRNLITRVNPVNNSAGSMHIALIEEIKEEYNYNVSQQIYVSGEVWHAVTRLRDQNIYIINQIAGSCAVDAEAKDLKFKILEYTDQEKSDLSTIVLDAIQFEAKKLLK